MDRIRILLADDHPAALELFARMLSAEFDVVGAAEDGEAAVRFALALLPDVLVLDVEMPRLDGFLVARRLAAAGCHARIVFLSAYGDPDYLDTALQVGASAYVLKARAAEDLLPAVHRALEGKQFISIGAGLARRHA
jgi:DNA-binding NarL/FixJ family response regulator